MADNDELIHVGEYLGVLRRSWWWVLAFAVLGGVTAHVVTELKTPIYQARAELVLDRQSASTILSPGMGGVKIDTTFMETQIRLLESEYLVARAVNVVLTNAAAGAAAPPASDPAPGVDGPFGGPGTVTSGPALREFVEPRSPAALAREITSGLRVGTLGRTRIISITTRSASPEFAAAAADALARAYEEYVSEAFASSAGRTFMVLRKQADEAARRIKDAARALLEFKRRSEIDMMVGNAAADESLEGERAAAIAERLALSDPEIASLADELVSVAQDVAGLSARYKPGHPRMQALLARQASLTERIEKLKTRAYAQWKSKYLAEQNDVESSMLERDLEATRRLHELLVSKMKEIDFSKESPEATAKILRAARVPGSPAYPKRSINLVLGALAGVAVGLFLVFTRAYSRSSLVSLGMRDDNMPAPVIGRLPHIRDGSVLQALLTGEETTSPAAEAFKALRTAIDSLLAPAHQGIVLVTSPDRNDGKSTVATVMAQSFAQLGRRVLLVDLDLRRGRLHRLFGLNSGNGVSDAVAHPETSIPPVEVSQNLLLLRRGTMPDNPAELLASPAMGSLIEQSAREYAIVILDSPPLLPVTDASLLARYADLRLMVVRSERTHLEACRFSANVLANLGHQINGLVLNDIMAHETRYYGHYRGYYQRAYGRAAKGET